MALLFYFSNSLVYCLVLAISVQTELATYTFYFYVLIFHSVVLYLFL